MNQQKLLIESKFYQYIITITVFSSFILNYHSQLYDDNPLSIRCA